MIENMPTEYRAARGLRRARNLRAAFWALAFGWVVGWLIKACTS